MARIPPERHPITPEHREKLERLSRCSFLPGSWDKRFVRDVLGSEAITARQAETIDRLYHRYRRQTQRTPLPGMASQDIMIQNECPQVGH